MMRLSRLLLFAGVLILAACAGEEHQDLKEWMRESSKDLRGHVPPLPELKPFPIGSYDASNLVDPFRASRIVPERAVAAGGNAPDFDRPKEPLEDYPLESLKMVGVMLPAKGIRKTAYALIRSSDKLYHVAAGNHIGQNFGVVTTVFPDKIAIKETVKDPTGQTSNWIEREVSLFLEGAKK